MLKTLNFPKLAGVDMWKATLLSAVLLIAALIVGCGAQPTSDGLAEEDISSTIQAAVAATVAAQQASQPNPTPIVTPSPTVTPWTPPTPVPTATAQVIPSATPYPRKWVVSTGQNPLDDTTTTSLQLIADEGTGTYGDPIRLVLRCESGKTDAYLIWYSFIGIDDAQVTVRIDSDPATTATYGISTNNQATFMRSSPETFVRNLVDRDAQRFVASVTPYSESPIVAVFDVAGLSAVVGPLRSECGF